MSGRTWIVVLGIALVQSACGSPQGMEGPTLCNDGIRNGSEADVDCGGTACRACAAAAACRAAGDCASSVCRAGRCQAPDCGDGVRNGGETDVDCGGTCSACKAGAACAAARDCASGVCKGAACQEPTCSDGVHNGSETDIDCGGACAPCQMGKACRLAAECSSGVCQGNRCVAPTCMDRVKNGGETDVDCGGACAPCVDGKKCGGGADCASLVCSGTTCQAPSCTDGVKNGGETDSDCGGARCGRCPQGKACGAPSDCASGNCAAQRCDAPNLVQDGATRRWSDGGFATSCYDYISPPAGRSYSGATGDGRYAIDPDGGGAIPPFDVYCDMSVGGGGWTLVDNDANDMDLFTTREAGANPDRTVTRGSYLPAYTWSPQPQLLCRSSAFGGAADWVTLNATGDLALEYPTQTTATGSYDGQWTIEELNGNADQGTGAWIYGADGRFGSVWIGNGGQPTCACNYYAPSPASGLGDGASSAGSTCSTWVR